MRRELTACLLLGLAGGGLVLLGAGRPWDAASALPAAAVDEVNPVATLASSLAAVVLLGTVVVAVTRAAGRRLSGSLVVLAALGVTYATLDADAAWSVWRGVVLLGAVLAALAGTMAAARGHRWTSMSRRYDAPSAERAAHESDPWRAMDRGDDPTL